MNHISFVASRGYQSHIERVSDIVRFHRRAQLPANDSEAGYLIRLRPHPMLREMTQSMLEARRTLLEQHNRCHKLVLQVVREDDVCRRFMTVPGVGPITALAFKTTIDDPRCFKKSKMVGAHLGRCVSI